MKKAVKYVLQSLLGLRRYLLYFALFKISTIKSDKKENDFFRFMEELPAEGMILDIGANIGIMTTHLARRFPKSKILSFEPMPHNFTTLKRVVNRFGLSNVELFNHALGDQSQEVEMVLPQSGGVKEPGLSHVVHETIPDFNEGKRFKTKVRKLDDLEMMKQSQVNVTGVKIDVENFESFVLRGAQQTLEKHRPVVYIELWDNDNRQKCFDFVRQLNYSIMVNEQGELVKYDSDKHDKQNFILLP